MGVRTAVPLSCGLVWNLLHGSQAWDEGALPMWESHDPMHPTAGQPTLRLGGLWAVPQCQQAGRARRASQEGPSPCRQYVVKPQHISRKAGARARAAAQAAQLYFKELPISTRPAYCFQNYWSEMVGFTASFGRLWKVLEVVSEGSAGFHAVR